MAYKSLSSVTQREGLDFENSWRKNSSEAVESISSVSNLSLAWIDEWRSELVDIKEIFNLEFA